MWWKKIFKKEDKPCVCHCQEKSLCEAGSGERLRIECLRGEDGACERLREMGFCEKSEVEKISQSGALICKVCDARVILSEGLAKNVIVKSICACHGHAEGSKTLLSQMKVGDRGQVIGISFEGDDYDRIEEMGLTPGETVEVIRYAPLGDPIEIRVRGYLLSLRRQEADLIQVLLSPNQS